MYDAVSTAEGPFHKDRPTATTIHYSHIPQATQRTSSAPDTQHPHTAPLGSTKLNVTRAEQRVPTASYGGSGETRVTWRATARDS